MKTYILQTKLKENKNASRDIEILGDVSLYKLAEAIVDAYNFDFDHCFGFFSEVGGGRRSNSERKYEIFTDLIEEGEDLEPTDVGPVKKTKVSDVWKRVDDKMLFLFDYGDNWEFIVELIAFGQKDVGKKYPKVIKKIGKAPKQYE